MLEVRPVSSHKCNAFFSTARFAGGDDELLLKLRASLLISNINNNNNKHDVYHDLLHPDAARLARISFSCITNSGSASSFLYYPNNNSLYPSSGPTSS
jgi:hypothetical protein